MKLARCESGLAKKHRCRFNVVYIASADICGYGQFVIRSPDRVRIRGSTLFDTGFTN